MATETDKMQHREKIMAVRMTERAYLDLKALARDAGLAPSLYAYLVIRQHMASKLDHVIASDAEALL